MVTSQNGGEKMGRLRLFTFEGAVAPQQGAVVSRVEAMSVEDELLVIDAAQRLALRLSVAPTGVRAYRGASSGSSLSAPVETSVGEVFVRLFWGAPLSPSAKRLWDEFPQP